MALNPKKIVLMGSNGQLGFELKYTLQGLGNLISLSRQELDLTDTQAIRTVLNEVRPDYIINSAAYTAVDLAEKQQDVASQLNVQAPAVLAEEAKKLHAVLIHYSTDYVFDGEKQTPYLETDAVNPQNVYGRTKQQGEEAIRSSQCAHLVLRSSWLYGWHGNNFMRTILQLAAKNAPIKIVSDQWGAPTWSYLVALTTAQIIVQSLHTQDAQAWWAQRSGIYHLASLGKTSWHGFATAILSALNPKKLGLLAPIRSEQYPGLAKRPVSSCLNQEKLQNTFGLFVPDWQEALKLCISRKDK